MSTENHIINKVSLQLNGVTTQTAFSWQQEMNSYLQDVLPRRLENMLDEQFPAGQWLKIEKLQINIESGRSLSAHQLQSLIEEEVKKQLQKKAVTGDVERNSVESVSPFKAWLFFLQHGHFPWWYGSGSMQHAEEDAKKMFLENPQHCTTLLQDTLQNDAACRRLVSQTTDVFYGEILSLLRFTRYEIEQWEQTVKGAVEERLAENFRWLEKGQRRVIQLAIRYAFLQMVVKGSDRSLRVDERVVHRIVAALKTSSFQAEAALVKLEDRHSAGPLLIDKKSNKSQSHLQTEPSHTFISNAGLVLFHPYLEYFFRSLNLLDESGKTILAPGKAVQLLHFLAYGETTCSESEAILNKLLCGMDQSEPVYTQYSLLEEEQAECNNLLEAVIRNWPALKNTSPEGLQKTFVQRTGKLSWKDDHWLLKVEQKTVDVLMNSLQWPISVIRLPWMKSWLQVEWN